MKRTCISIKTIFAILLFLSAFAQNIPVASATAFTTAPQASVTLTVRASSRAESLSALSIENPQLAKAIIRAKIVKVESSTSDVWPDVEVEMKHGTGSAPLRFRLERTGNLWDENTKQRRLISEAYADKLLGYAATLRSAHYGKLIRWNEVRSIVPLKSIFSVTDIESGLMFRVQRRAGRDHADVQPISKEDAKIMKEIYGGEWSWDRRAIVVVSGGRRIAASMNGMPHGGDGIPGNGFSGHFCIHFQESTSHKSDVPDPAHQLMIHKAAGNLQSYLDIAPPFTLAASFIEALHQHDEELLSRIWPHIPPQTLAYFFEWMKSLTSIRIKADTLRKQPDDERNPHLGDALAAMIEIPVTLYRKGQSGHGATYRFEFKRETPQSPWRIVDVRSPTTPV